MFSVSSVFTFRILPTNQWLNGGGGVPASNLFVADNTISACYYLSGFPLFVLNWMVPRCTPLQLLLEVLHDHLHHIRVKIMDRALWSISLLAVYHPPALAWFRPYFHIFDRFVYSFTQSFHWIAEKKNQNAGSSVTDEEIRQAEEKFAESLHLAQMGMNNILDNDVSASPFSPISFCPTCFIFLFSFRFFCFFGVAI